MNSLLWLRKKESDYSYSGYNKIGSPFKGLLNLAFQNFIDTIIETYISLNYIPCNLKSHFNSTQGLLSQISKFLLLKFAHLDIAKQTNILALVYPKKSRLGILQLNTCSTLLEDHNITN